MITKITQKNGRCTALTLTNWPGQSISDQSAARIISQAKHDATIERREVNGGVAFVFSEANEYEALLNEDEQARIAPVNRHDVAVRTPRREYRRNPITGHFIGGERVRTSGA